MTAGITVLDELANNAETIHANQTGIRLAILKGSDLTGVGAITGATTNGVGFVPTISHAAIVPGDIYHIVFKFPDGSVGVTQEIVAS